MKNKKNILVGGAFLILILFCGIFSYFKITYSYFGNNITGQLGTTYSVDYFSNYPEEIGRTEQFLFDSAKINSDYVVKDIMFEISNQYKFTGWNTKRDGSGIFYNVNDLILLNDNFKLYAIWESASLYGDINLDGKIDIADSELLNKYLNENTSLEGVLISNSDVNLDGKIDLVDVDIIKQASLGTKGYGGLLSNNPVNIYEVYKDNTINDGGGSTNNDIGNNTGKPSNKPSNNNGSNNQNGSNTNDISSNVNGENNKNEDVFDENTNVSNKNEVNINEDDKNRKSYAWILILGILLISLRVVVAIIKKIIKIKKSDNNDTI